VPDRVERTGVQLPSWQRSILAAIVAIAIAEGLAALVVWTGDGFGAGDLLPFVIWLLPFGLLTFATTRALATLVRRLGATRPLRALFAAALGAAVGYAWTLAMAAMMGPWFGTFSFPVGWLLVVSGALAHAFALSAGRRD
jgi:hypothetical protein